MLWIGWLTTALGASVDTDGDGIPDLYEQGDTDGDGIDDRL